MTPRTLKIRSNLAHAYQDVYTADAINALEELARFDADRKAAMAARIERAAACAHPGPAPTPPFAGEIRR